MTEISKINERKKLRYSINPIAFVIALLLAPLLVTLLSFWTIIGLFAIYFGLLPYLIVGTPILIWAVGRIKPTFGAYACLGLFGNVAMGIAGFLIMAPQIGHEDAITSVLFLAGFGFIFAPLYAGAFGSLYAAFHPKIRILQT
ncbi:MAG: hypothetical protein AAFQ09_13095 [Pseudomonadota bacterium]